MARRFIGSVVVTLGLLALAGAAGAVTDEERAGARAAAEEGQRAFDAGRYEEAVNLFSRAESLVHAIPHLIYIARSNEKLGRLVRAREAYLKVQREELAPNAPAAFKAAKEAANTELPAIEARLARITIHLEGADGKEVRVTVGGVTVPAALLGVAYPVDPGKHTIEAIGEGVAAAPVEVTLSEGGSETVTLKLSPSAGAALPNEPGPGPDSPGLSATTEGMSPMKLGGFVSLGVGVVGLGVGTVFLVQGGAKQSDSDDVFSSCDPNCSAAQKNQIVELDNDARSMKRIATAGFIVGGVGIAAGVTLLLLDAGREQKSARVTPWIGLGSAGVSGSF